MYFFLPEPQPCPLNNTLGISALKRPKSFLEVILSLGHNKEVTRLIFFFFFNSREGGAMERDYLFIYSTKHSPTHHAPLDTLRRWPLCFAGVAPEATGRHYKLTP